MLESVPGTLNNSTINRFDSNTVLDLFEMHLEEMYQLITNTVCSTDLVIQELLGDSFKYWLSDPETEYSTHH